MTLRGTSSDRLTRAARAVALGVILSALAAPGCGSADTSEDREPSIDLRKESVVWPRLDGERAAPRTFQEQR